LSKLSCSALLRKTRGCSSLECAGRAQAFEVGAIRACYYRSTKEQRITYTELHPALVAAVVEQPRIHGEMPAVLVGAGADVVLVVDWAFTAERANRARRS
jgi:hypothetical protein